MISKEFPPSRKKLILHIQPKLYSVNEFYDLCRNQEQDIITNHTLKLVMKVLQIICANPLTCKSNIVHETES